MMFDLRSTYMLLGCVRIQIAWNAVHVQHAPTTRLGHLAASDLSSSLTSMPSLFSKLLKHDAGEKSLLDQDIPSLASKYPNGDFATSDLYSAIAAGNFPQWCVSSLSMSPLTNARAACLGKFCL